MLQGLFALARAPEELAEAEVAVGDEGAHAEPVGEPERFRIPLVGIGVSAYARRYRAGHAQCVCLEAGLGMGTREIQGPRRGGRGELEPARPEIRLGEGGHSEGLLAENIGGTGLAHRFLERAKRIIDAPTYEIG